MSATLLRLAGSVSLCLAFSPVAWAQHGPFVPAPQGNAMAHADPSMSDQANMPVPAGPVSVRWRDEQGAGSLIGLGATANGSRIACTVGNLNGRDNLVVYDAGGRRLFTSGTRLNALAMFSAPMIDAQGGVIAADTQRLIRWSPSGQVLWDVAHTTGAAQLPISPVPVNGGDQILLATLGGPIVIHDASTGARRGELQIADGARLFDTANTPGQSAAGVVYVAMSERNGGRNPQGLLVALDVRSGTPRELWRFPFPGPSGASPLVIGDTVYFDGMDPDQGPIVYAVRDQGGSPDLRWRCETQSLNPNWELFDLLDLPVAASFARDPRGGLWVFVAGSRFLHRLGEADGRTIDSLDLDALIAAPGLHVPASALTVAGDAGQPVLLVNALGMLGQNYAAAIDLNSGRLRWKAQLDSGTRGQFAVVRDPGSGDPLVVLTQRLSGAVAIGPR